MSKATDRMNTVIDRLRADRDKYKAFAEWLGGLCVERGIIKDVAPPVPGMAVQLGSLLSPAAEKALRLGLPIGRDFEPADITKFGVFHIDARKP
jgi:hypothetical protein